ncbi:hypothetical protein WI75_08715 [Burkholderia ubonensis]|nr:hypothetical protein WI75_08715 [Burkholderia ubonensis]
MATKDIRKAEAARRRARLAELIHLHFEDKQKAFIDLTGINQGELSSLLKDKSFGSVKARGIELAAGILSGSLDAELGSPFYEADTYHESIGNQSEIKSQIGGMIVELSASPSPSIGNEHAIPLHYPARQTGIRRVFVVGRAQGGLPERLWTDGDYPVGATDEYTEIATNDPHAFLTPVVGTSMVPRYNPGEFAFVSPALEPQAGDDVLVRLHTGQTLIKKLTSTRGGVVELYSYNEREQGPLFFRLDEITWMYYIGYPVPARMIKNMT